MKKSWSCIVAFYLIYIQVHLKKIENHEKPNCLGHSLQKMNLIYNKETLSDLFQPYISAHFVNGLKLQKIQKEISQSCINQIIHGHFFDRNLGWDG